MAVRSRSHFDVMRRQIERQLKNLESASIPVAFTSAIRSFLTAMEYNDSIMMKAHLESAQESFADVMIESIEKRAKHSRRARSVCDKFVNLITGVAVCADLSFDEFGRELQEFQRSNLKVLTDLQSSVVVCLKHGLSITNAATLENEIKKWQEFDDSILKPWPWTTRQRKPVDRAMVEAARASNAQDSYESMDDLIGRLKGA